MTIHDLIWFLNQVRYLDWIKWNLEAGCVIDLQEWCCMLSNSMHYEKYQKWPKEVVWFIYVSKWVMGAFEWLYEETHWKMCQVNHGVNF